MKKTMILYLMIITMLTLVACSSDVEDMVVEAEVVTEETENVENKETKKVISEVDKNSYIEIDEEKPKQIDKTDESKKDNNLETNPDSEKNTSTESDKTVTKTKKTTAYNNNDSSSSKPVTNTANSQKLTTSPSKNESTSNKTTTTKADTSSKTNPTKTKPSSGKVTTPKPVITTKNETKTQTIDFKTVKQNDNTLEKGKEVISREGVKGTKTIVYKITYTDGKQTSKVETSNTVTKQPVDKIVKVGTKEAPKKEVILLGQIGNSGKEFATVEEAVDWAYELYDDDERWFATGYGGWRAEPIFYGYILEDGTKKGTRTTYTIVFFE